MDTPVADRQSRRLQAPDTARAITSCWISLAPSKIVLCSVRSFLGVTSCGYRASGTHHWRQRDTYKIPYVFNPLRWSRTGLALYFAQVVEQSLVQLIVVTRIAEGKLNPSLAEYDKLVDRLDKKTLGQALHTARMYTQLSDEQEAMATEALRLRNFVAHSFFRERIELFLTETGRKLMCDELADAAEYFARTDELLTESMFALGITFGLTRERAEEQLEAMKSRWRDG